MGRLLLAALAAGIVAASIRLEPRGAGRWRERARQARAPEPDPFEVLRLQMRLGMLAEEVRALERSGDVYARGHHLKATQAAYDALLIEACRLAGVAMTIAPDARPTVPQGEQERFREEVELASRGWSW